MLLPKKWALCVMGMLCLIASANNFSPDNVIRGKVIEEDTKMPLVGVAVIIKGSDPIVGTITDVNGLFEFEPMPVGRYHLQFQFLGYESQTIPNVLLSSGKETVLSISMRESITGLQEVKVLGSTKKGEAKNSMAMISARSFSVEETQRYAGGFNDPARMVASYAGVMADPSGNNEIIVRGNSPRGLQWRIEGVPVANPNHFANEGATGGAIGILNSSILSNSDFYTSAFPAEFGNAVSGVFDIDLRQGNDQKREYVVQGGVLGLDAAAEGPLGNGGSYLVNARYSSLALLKSMGVKVAGEAVPEYGDASFNINLPGCKNGRLQLFGVAGYSNIEADEEDYKQDFEADMWVTGLNYLCPLNERTYLKSSVSYNGTFNKWYYEEYVKDSESYEFRGSDRFEYHTLRLGADVTHKVSSQLTLKGGAYYNQQFYNMNMLIYDDEQQQVYTALDDDGSAGFINGYASVKWRPASALTITAGAHAQYLQLNNNYSIDPRLGMRYQVNDKHAFTAGVGLHSKAENTSIYLARTLLDDGQIVQYNKNLDMMKSMHYVVGYENRISRNLLLKLEAYYQNLYDVPVEMEEGSSYSILNDMSGYITERLNNDGTGKNYGIEATLEKYLSNNVYFLLTSSVFNAKYTAFDKRERNSRFNNGYVVNFTGGKDFFLGQEKNKTLGLNLRTIVAGGNYYSPIDVNESQDKGYTIRPDELAFSQQRDDFFKVDLKVSYKVNRKKSTHTLELDIQNITNAQAVVYDYWHPNKEVIEEGYQWALFPVINYRIEF
ncbi:TonB-dependent receptor [Carboxylicivirga sp. M1479]|uniref:TonB-dependent receptor n=1 Tax=Carboxylicivirga sp. M1479 TaxID=2594476 RepID=UPI0011782643|nr:TonB-dependent receptor [Carboxylicivirga sp. M1479]TRX72667.1 TonB-dependent receptor [Carboxylicivirga sp. M1479]